MEEQLPRQQPSQDNTMQKKSYLLDFQETAQPEQHLPSNADIDCFRLQTQNYQRIHILFVYALKMGVEGMIGSS